MRPVHFEWGSWVHHIRGAVNAPGDEYSYVRDDSFWNSTEWANELYREIRRRERAARKAESSTLLALAAGRWECERRGREHCSRGSNVASAPPYAVDVVGMMRARTPKETGVCDKRSARCLKPSR